MVLVKARQSEVLWALFHRSYPTDPLSSTTWPSLHQGIHRPDLQHFFYIIFTNKLPSAIKPYLRDTYLFCLHKDPDDPTKLRPIGVPTAIRRIIGNHIATTYRCIVQFNVFSYPFLIF